MKYKIAHVITRLIEGGAQRVCLDLIENLDKDRFDVTLIAGVETGSEGSYWNEVEERKIHSIKVAELVRNLSPLIDCIAFYKLRRLFRQGRYDLVHMHTSKAGVLGVLAARSAGIPAVIYSSHGHIFDPKAQISGISKKILKPLFWVRRLVYEKSDAVIALTEQDRNEQVKLGLAQADKFRVISNGIDLNRFRSEPSERCNKDSFPVLVTVCRLSSEKGLTYLLEAASKLRRDFPKMRLDIVGDGPEKERLMAVSGRLDLHEVVRFVGKKKNVELYLKEADIFVLPSLYEAMGIAIAEAMAMGLPVVATRVGGVPDLIENGVNGFLVSPQDSDAIADTILRIANDPPLAGKMRQENIKKAHEKFGLQIMIRETLRLYQDILQRSRT